MLRLTLFLSIFAAIHAVPSFKWLNDRSSEAGVPLLAVHFSKDDVDYVALEPFNPVPLVANEREEDVDSCIFKGHLMSETGSSIVMTGGCPYSMTFEMLITSEKLTSHMLKVENGVVTELESPFKDSQKSDALHIFGQSSSEKSVFERQSLPSSGMTLKVGVQYDQLFKGRFGADSVNAVRRVLAYVQQIYNLPSLTTRLNINTLFINELPVSFNGGATNGNLNLAQQYTSSSVNSNVFVTYNNGQYGIVGLAYLGVVCNPNQQIRSNIDVWIGSDLLSGLIISHEIGHNLGMSHDFSNGTPGSPRYDSTGRTCTNIGGVMDYNQRSITWSRCSVEDFTRYFARNQPFCLLPGGNPGGVVTNQQQCIANGRSCVSPCRGVGFSSSYVCNFSVGNVQYRCSCSYFAGQGRAVVEKLPPMNSTSLASDAVVSKLPEVNSTAFIVAP